MAGTPQPHEPHEPRSRRVSRRHPPRVSRQHHDAVLFDLDGVLTRTAAMHETAWTATFNEWLTTHAPTVTPFTAPFSPDDYRQHVDGKPRFDGVADFLASRHIDLPWGHPSDPPGTPTVCGVGNAKQETFERLIAGGVETFPDGVGLLHSVVDAGLRVAVVSSSRNCAAILAAADLDALVEVQVDGSDVETGGVAGKPAPDAFLLACERLGADRRRAVVVEDARSGVEAGAAGGFALVVGVDRTGHRDDLVAAGADVVVDDLMELAPLG